MLVSDELFLAQGNFRGIVRAAAERIERSKPLIFADSVPMVDAADEEVMAKFTGSAFAADIIADDAEAVVHEGGNITFTTTDIPNIKHGRFLTQAQDERMNRIRLGLGTGTDRNLFANWRDRAADELTFGVKQRRNYLSCCMMTDTIAYNRLGVQISGTWGMPADLKFTEDVDWDDHANGLPVTGLLTAKRHVAVEYGVMYDTAIMSTAAFYHMVQTAEFKARIAGIVNYAVPAGAYSPQSPDMERFALQILGLRQIILEDATYKTRQNDGSIVTSRYNPVPRVILTSGAALGNSSAWDFANAIVSESRKLAQRGEGAESFGPYGYSTTPQDLNPPNETYWVVQRGFPRKHDDYASAVINTGDYTS